MSSICLIDGTYELYRAFFGAPPRVSGDGREVGAAYGLGRSLWSLRQRGDFTHYAIAFDTVIESFRNDLFDGYKTGEGVPPQLFAQFPLAEELARALGFEVLSMIEFEADDALATLAELADRSGRFEKVWIASPDKDLMQCVRTDRVVVWDRSRSKVYDEPAVVEKFGISPESIPDYLALVGDSADGIPGVPGWGAKSASTVLGVVKHLEAIPREVGAFPGRLRGAAALLQSLNAHSEEVLLYRVLATLRRDVPVSQDFDTYLPREPDLAALTQLEALGLVSS